MQWPIAPTTAHELMELPQRPFIKFEIQVPDGGAWIDICDYWGLGATAKKNYLLDVSFTTGGARMMAAPIAGQFSAVIDNPNNIFHPYHPTSGAQGFFRVGRRVRIALGGHFASGDNDWWRLYGFMDEPQFSSDTLKVNITGLDYTKRLADMKFTKEIQGAYPGVLPTPIDNYWGNIYTRGTSATAVVPGPELYNEADCLDILGDANNIGAWAVGVNCARAWANDGVGVPPSVNQLWIQKHLWGGITSGYTELDNPPSFPVTLGTEYRVSFYYRQVNALANPGRLIMGVYEGGVGGALIKDSGNCTSGLLPYILVTFSFISTITGNVKLRFTVEGGVGSAVEFYIDNVSIYAMTLGANKPYRLPVGCNGIYYVELDNQDGAGLQPVWPGKQGDPGEGWYYDIATRWFSFDKDKFINTGANNLNIWYFTTQQAQSVVADILVKAYPTVFVAVGPASARDAAMLAMQSPWTGVGIDRVWFKAGSTYIDAIRMLCERCNYRFYFNGNGDPRFVPAPTPAAAPIFIPFLPKHSQSPIIYQSKSEIWNRIVIEGEKIAELTGWEENMPSELKDEAFDNVSILNYGTRTKKITNHLFQDLPRITAMCAILLAAYKDPKWYIDFETPYNAAPMEISDTIQVDELLDITLADVVHICLIRDMSVSLYDAIYKCEIKMPE